MSRAIALVIPIDPARARLRPRRIAANRPDSDGDIYRAVYTAAFPEVVYTRDAFVKKSKSGINMPQADKEAWAIGLRWRSPDNSPPTASKLSPERGRDDVRQALGAAGHKPSKKHARKAASNHDDEE